MQVGSLGQEDPLEEGMATHSSILAWRIPWTEEPGSLQSIGSQKSGTWLSNQTTTIKSRNPGKQKESQPKQREQTPQRVGCQSRNRTWTKGLQFWHLSPGRWAPRMDPSSLSLDSEELLCQQKLDKKCYTIWNTRQKCAISLDLGWKNSLRPSVCGIQVYTSFPDQLETLGPCRSSHECVLKQFL